MDNAAAANRQQATRRTSTDADITILQNSENFGRGGVDRVDQFVDAATVATDREVRRWRGGANTKVATHEPGVAGGGQLSHVGSVHGRDGAGGSAGGGGVGIGSSSGGEVVVLCAYSVAKDAVGRGAGNRAPGETAGGGGGAVNRAGNFA